MNAYTRKKEPERVRQSLLECAARLAVEEGIAGVTVQSVAASAGVTKGGLFHHFPTKAALLSGLFADLLRRLDSDIDAKLNADPIPNGRFTRAYVEAIFHDDEGGFDEPWVALSVAMIADPELCPIWTQWLRDRLERHADTDSGLMLETVRLAADGVWLSRVSNYQDALTLDLRQLKAHFIALTVSPEAAAIENSTINQK